MSIKFDFGKFAQNMQTLGSDMLKNTVLLASTRRMPPCGGFYGPSIWGCPGGLTGGFPMNSLYGPYPMLPGQTDPYLTQFGLDGAYRRAEKYYNEAPVYSPTGRMTQTPTDTTFGKEFSDSLKTQKEFSFVTDKWQELNAKEDLTEDEEAAVADAYRESAKELGKSYISYLDKEHGNNNGEMTLDEYTTYLIDTLVGPDASAEDKANVTQAAQEAFKKLDLNGSNTLDAKDMAAVMVYLATAIDNDVNGKINPQDYGNLQQQLISDSGQIVDALKPIYKRLFGE